MSRQLPLRERRHRHVRRRLRPDARLPNNYDFEPIDLDGDGLQDLVTINDGPASAEHVFASDGAGGFVDATDDLWPRRSQPAPTTTVVVLDDDSDGDPDFLIGSLDRPTAC